MDFWTLYFQEDWLHSSTLTWNSESSNNNVQKDKNQMIWTERNQLALCVSAKPSANENTGTSHFVTLCFIALHRYCVFYKVKVGGYSAWRKSISAISATVFAHFVSLCHIFQTFSLLLYLLWWCVISDHWCYFQDSLKAQMIAFFNTEAFFN